MRPLSITFTAALAIILAPLQGYAQAYPSKAVRVVIPWPPGGSNETVGRLVMQKVAEVLGKPFVIDLRPGAAGTIGAELVARSPADGYTLMVHSSTHIANAHLYPKLPYDTLKDFAGVALLASQPGVLIVHPSMPVRTVKEFIALARSHPGAINYASSGSGSGVHLSMALLIQMTGINVVHIPYKGGAPQAISTVAGETQAGISAIASTLTQINSGRLRPLGVTSAHRSRALPDVPTIAEAGVPGYEMSVWIAVLAPAGTPKNIIARLHDECTKVVRRPEISEKMFSQAVDPWTGTVEEFDARIKSDYEKVGRLIKLTGAKVD